MTNATARRTAYPPRYSRTVEAALLKLDALGSSESWTAFAMLGRYNCFRWLKRYALVVDANEAARRAYLLEHEGAEDMWARFPSRWQLTDRGRACVAAIKEGNNGGR